jgi:hypothetical protein
MSQLDCSSKEAEQVYQTALRLTARLQRLENSLREVEKTDEKRLAVAEGLLWLKRWLDKSEESAGGVLDYSSKRTLVRPKRWRGPQGNS